MTDTPIQVRIRQAIEEISDESIFTPDQIIKLNNAFIMIGWGVREELAARHPTEDK